MFTEDQLLPLSALQHWLYCPRQCALIHLEQVWAENRFTAEGQTLHKKAHEGPDETRAGVRITRSLPVRSLTLGISGQCDVVEFHRAGGDFKSEISNLKCKERIVPVEYKRGKPKAHRADEVQLCAQAICLEEMLGVAIPEGALFYGATRRRMPVAFDAELRALTTQVATEARDLLETGRTPSPVWRKSRCGRCSLVNVCRPQALAGGRSASQWLERQLRDP